MDDSKNDKAPGKLKDKEGFAEKKAVLDKHLQDKNVASTTDFQRAGDKAAGLSQGYVAKRKEDSHTFLLKAAEKTNVAGGRIGRDRQDFVTEYVTAPIYQRMLFDRAPVFELTVQNEVDATKYGTPTFTTESNTTIYGRSKFFDDYQELGAFAGSGNLNIDPDHPNLQKIEGFEKVIAACLLAGETDYHAGNLGVVSKIGDDGKMHHSIVKIDHGASDWRYSNYAGFMKDLQESFSKFGYENIPFDVREFKAAIDEMMNISDEEIENIIDSRFDKLVKSGFKFKGLETFIFVNGASKTAFVKDDTEASIKALRDNYVATLKANRQVLREVSAKLDVIANIVFEDKAGKANPLMAIGSNDPVKYAINNNLTIREGAVEYDAVEYAIKKGIPIDGMSPEKYGMDVLKSSVEYYSYLKGLGTNRNPVEDDLLERAEKRFKAVQGALNGGKEVLDANSDLGQFLNSSPSFVIAEKLGAGKVEPGASSKVDEDLLKGCSLDVLARIEKVTSHIDTGLKETPLSYYLHMFVDFMKNLAGKGASDDKLNLAAKDLEKIIPPETKAKDGEKEVLGKFTERVLQSRGSDQSKGR